MREKTWLAAAVGMALQLGLATTAFALDGVNSVERLLSQLSHTLQEQNYRGLFTYEYGGTLDTLEIVHVVEGGREFERLQHLSGPSRRVIRDGRPVACTSPGARLLRGGALSPNPDEQLHQYYDFNVGGMERVADRPATVVRLVPKDHYRYGLTLSIDKASGFPTKTLIISDSRKVLERIQFVELEMDVDPDALVQSDQEKAYLAAINKSCGTVESGASSAREPLRWDVTWLPQGFVLSDQNHSEGAGHQLTYTDGLASFSVFIESSKIDGPTQPGVAQRGATVALSINLPLKEHPANVSVVGEVPPVTAEQVALGIRVRKSGD